MLKIISSSLHLRSPRYSSARTSFSLSFSFYYSKKYREGGARHLRITVRGAMYINITCKLKPPLCVLYSLRNSRANLPFTFIQRSRNETNGFLCVYIYDFDNASNCNVRSRHITPEEINALLTLSRATVDCGRRSNKRRKNKREASPRALDRHPSHKLISSHLTLRI